MVGHNFSKDLNLLITEMFQVRRYSFQGQSLQAAFCLSCLTRLIITKWAFTSCLKCSELLLIHWWSLGSCYATDFLSMLGFPVPANFCSGLLCSCLCQLLGHSSVSASCCDPSGHLVIHAVGRFTEDRVVTCPPLPLHPFHSIVIFPSFPLSVTPPSICASLPDRKR